MGWSPQKGHQPRRPGRLPCSPFLQEALANKAEIELRQWEAHKKREGNKRSSIKSNLKSRHGHAARKNPFGDDYREHRNLQSDMQLQNKQSDSLIPPAPRTDATLSAYGVAGQCQCLCCCAARAPAPSYVDWTRVWDSACRATAPVAIVAERCAQTIAAAAPYAIGFYGATAAIKAGVAALASRGSWLRCAVELRPLCRGHLSGLAAVCAVAYAVESTARDRRRQRLPGGLVGLASQVVHMSAALGMAACCLGSLAHRLACSEVLRERWWHHGINDRYERGMADGIILCAVVAIGVASAVIVFQSPCQVITDIRRATAQIIDVDPLPPATDGFDLHCRRRPADLDDLLLPLANDDQEQCDAEEEQVEP